MKQIKKMLYDFLRNNDSIRKAARKIVWKCRSIVYKMTTGGIKPDEKTVLFETFMGRQYGCNPKAIYERMLNDSRFDDFSFIWAFKDTEKAKEHSALERSKIVKHRSREYFKCIARSGAVITNSEMDYRISPKKGQTFFQTWHGTPLKRLRCDINIENGNANNTLEEIKLRNAMDVVRYDYFLSPSEFASEKFRSAFNLDALKREGIVFEAGYPRNDMLFNYDHSDIVDIKCRLGIPEDKKVILYAPTFRDNKYESAEGYVYDLNLDFERLQKEFGSDHVVIFRAHYFVANQFDFDKYDGFVINASHLDDITELYIVSDMLITDYSSVFFDYANLKRKIVFYMYDLEQYQNDIRGFYISLDELPGKIVTTEDALIDEIKCADFEYDDKYAEFNSKYNYLDDGHAAERVIEKVFGDSF